jgi:CheY-like chemotaxis protein
VSDLPLNGLRILLMEDEALIALDLEQLCRESGADDVVVVRNLDQVDTAANGVFHAAILDVMLSGNPTVEFARTLTQKGVPFVFATGYADREELFSEFPDTPVIGKPYVGADLVNALAGAIARKG